MTTTDYCAKLMERLKNNNYTIKITKPPKYLSCFGINDEEIIIVHQMLQPKSPGKLFHSKRIYSTMNQSTNSPDFEITGHPLECTFEDTFLFDDTIFEGNHSLKTEEDCHAPLQEGEARKCLAISNLHLKPTMPIWVLTEPRENDATVLLGSYVEDGWCSRSWVTIQRMSIAVEAISSMITEHKEIAVLPNVQLNSKVTSYFYPSRAEENCVESARDKDIALEVTWKKPSFEVPINEADVFVIIKTKIGDRESITAPLWEQVELLNMYLDTITKWRKERSHHLPYQRDYNKIPSRNNSDVSAGNLTDRVMNLMKASDLISFVRDTSKSKSEVCKSVNEVVQEVIQCKHLDQDFLDKLWSVIIDATTYQEIDSCVKLVFQQVKIQGLKPYIKAKNGTRFAHVLNNANNDINNELMLEPLELLVELGLEKLKNDYVYIFNRSQLANRELIALPNLPNFFQVYTNDDWESSVSSWLRWFTRIHTVLEMVCLTEEKLGSIFECTRSVSCVALKKYLGKNSPVSEVNDIIKNPLHEITAPINASDVISVIGNGCLFYKWLLNLSSESTSRKVTSSYLVTTKLPFPHNIMELITDKVHFNNTVFPDETAVFLKKDSSLQYIAKLTTVEDKFY